MGLTAIGILGGIGSMLVGAEQAGFKVIGNIEDRNVFNTGTFENYFDTWQVKTIDEIPSKDKKKIDLAMGLPACGNFSAMNTNAASKKYDPGEIPKFVRMLQELNPRYFVMDNLPRSLIAFGMENWADAFPQYDLFFEFISNYNYGNSQKNRKRFFVIGAKKAERFVFQAGEFKSDMVLSDVIGDLPPRRNIPAINHRHIPDTGQALHWSRHGITPGYGRAIPITVAELKDFIRKQNIPLGKNIPSFNLNGKLTERISLCRITLNRPSHTLIGTGGIFYREDTLNMLTIRERARIMGLPDHFIFIPTDFIGTKYHSKFRNATGKCIPVDFCRFVSKQIYAHRNDHVFQFISGKRFASSPWVDRAKLAYCETRGIKKRVGKKVCNACWLQDSC